jgi:predicted transcriptional regulator
MLAMSVKSRATLMRYFLSFPVRAAFPLGFEQGTVLLLVAARPLMVFGGVAVADGETTAISFLMLTGKIVAAYVRENAVPTSGLSGIIESIHSTLQGIASGESNAPGITHRPAVSVKKSVTSDYIVCLEDGKKLKMLKRYIRSRYGLSPEEYRAKWRLPADYPMVAAEYAARRSAFAKKIGLGRTRRVGGKLRNRS